MRVYRVTVLTLLSMLVIASTCGVFRLRSLETQLAQANLVLLQQQHLAEINTPTLDLMLKTQLAQRTMAMGRPLPPTFREPNPEGETP